MADWRTIGYLKDLGLIELGSQLEMIGLGPLLVDLWLEWVVNLAIVGVGEIVLVEKVEVLEIVVVGPRHFGVWVWHLGLVTSRKREAEPMKIR